MPSVLFSLTLQKIMRKINVNGIINYKSAQINAYADDNKQVKEILRGNIWIIDWNSK